MDDARPPVARGDPCQGEGAPGHMRRHGPQLIGVPDRPPGAGTDVPPLAPEAIPGAVAALHASEEEGHRLLPRKEAGIEGVLAAEPADHMGCSPNRPNDPRGTWTHVLDFGAKVPEKRCIPSREPRCVAHESYFRTSHHVISSLRPRAETQPRCFRRCHQGKPRQVIDWRNTEKSASGSGERGSSLVNVSKDVLSKACL